MLTLHQKKIIRAHPSKFIDAKEEETSSLAIKELKKNPKLYKRAMEKMGAVDRLDSDWGEPPMKSNN